MASQVSESLSTTDYQPSTSVVPLNPQPSTLNFLKSLRLCFIAGTLGQGGAERQLYYILKCLREYGTDVSLLILNHGEFWEEPIRELGVPVMFVGRSGSRIARLLAILKNVRRLRPHVLQSQHSHANLYSAIPGRLLRTLSVGAVRNDGCVERNANGRFWGKLNLTLPSWLAVNSHQAIFNLTSKGYNPKKFLFLPNVIDTDRFQPGTSRKSHSFTILGVGRLELSKRFDRFLEIITLLAGRIPCPLNVRVAGDGTQRPFLESLAQNARAKGVQVEFLGAVSNPLPLYQEAHALLLTSDHEGTPNVIMEAMACGLPVVATSVGGIQELIDDKENGVLFSPKEIDRAVISLERISKDHGFARTMSEQARLCINKRHSVRLLPAVLSSFYDKILVTNPCTCKNLGHERKNIC